MSDSLCHLTWLINQSRELGLQTAGLTTAPWSADDGIHPIFDEFLRKLGGEYKQ